ncbi:MAG: response regulator [Balneolaceae bacterium]
MDEDRVSTLTKHQIEKLLLKKADHFERLTKDLSEKNAELRETQKQLIAEKEIAESATKAKAMFLANMSHEIRTPMNAVIGMTEILKETNPSKEQLTFIETIHKSGYDLVHIINDILDYSKVESGKMELEVQPINLHELVSETANLLVLKAEEKNIELIYYIDEEIPPVLHADPTRLKQILVNLVNNAIKFTSVGEVVIEITLEKKLASEAIINFKVIDTGIGIPENKINHIFDSFSQVDASTTRNYGGTGLGLTITKSLVELMSGEVSVTSTTGEGSTFKFVVGLPYTASISKSPRHASLFKNKTLLFADQNASHRKYLRKKLQSLGFNVNAFQTIEELIANIKAVPAVDLILVEDFLLGNMTDSVKEGFEQLLKTGQIPLIKMLPFGKVPDLKKVNSLSIKRPLKRENLISVLTTALEGNSKKSPKSSAKKTHEPKDISVLLAEDNKTNQLVAKGLLKSIGYQIEIVDNGVDVISKLDEKYYDLILMDVQMPVLDGLEATQKIRDLEFKPGQPIIIAMTANAMEEDRDRCIEAGMNDYLSKPVKRDEIIEKIEKWFPDN